MKHAAWVLSLALAAFVMACGSGEEQTSSGSAANQVAAAAPAKSAKTFAFAMGAEPPSLDPSYAEDIAGMNIMRNTFEPILRMDDDGTSLPGLAETWEHDGTYTTWTFHLREDAKWSNGDPVTAQDCVFGIKRILNPDTAAPMGMMVYMFLQGGEDYFTSRGAHPETLGVEALDDYTLKITLTGPTPYFPSLLSHPAWFPLHKPTIDKYGDDWAQNPESLVVNGPFMPQTILPKSRMIAVRNPYFHSPDEIYWDRVEFYYIEQTMTELAAYEAGDIDMTSTIPNREAKELMKRPDFGNVPMIGVYFVTFNVTDGPFMDLDLRRAFSASINRGLIADRIARRGELPATGFIPRGMTMPDGQDYRDVAPVFFENDDYEANLKRAKEILANAGYATADRPIPRMEYLFNSDEVNEDVAQTLQTFWNSQLGAEVQLNKVEWGVLLKRIRSKDFQIARSSWIGDYLDPLTFLEIYETGHEKNGPGYSSERYDNLLAQIRTEADADKRLELIIAAERIILEEDCLVSPIYEYNTPVLLRPGIEGVIQTPLAGVDITRARRTGN